MYVLIFSHVVFNLLQTKKSEIEEELSRANEEITLLKQSGGDNTASIQSLQAQVHIITQNSLVIGRANNTGTPRNIHAKIL